MRNVLSLLACALLASQTYAAPAPPPSTPAPSTPANAPKPIPPPPKDPPKKKGDGAGGEWNSAKDTNHKDYDAQNKAKTLSDVAAPAMPNAARFLDHYLESSGRNLPINVDTLIEGIPELKENINYDKILQGQNTAGSIPGESGTDTFKTDWVDMKAPKGSDWYYALREFQYSMTGTVTKQTPDSAIVEYQVHIFDRYNWDKGESVSVSGVTVNYEDLGDLHLHGLAKEYIIRGSTPKHTIKDVTNVPLPPKPKGRKDEKPPKKPDQPKDPHANDYKTKGCKITADALRHRPCSNTSKKCPAFGQYPKNESIKFSCYVKGESIKGDWSKKSTKWGKDSKGHYLALAFIEGSCAKHIPKCK